MLFHDSAADRAAKAGARARLPSPSISYLMESGTPMGSDATRLPLPLLSPVTSFPPSYPPAQSFPAASLLSGRPTIGLYAERRASLPLSPASGSPSYPGIRPPHHRGHLCLRLGAHARQQQSCGCSTAHPSCHCRRCLQDDFRAVGLSRCVMFIVDEEIGTLHSQPANSLTRHCN